MALDTFANLKTSIASWLNREDLTSQIPDFITMAEARFNRELRVNAMIQRDTTFASSDFIELPDDWLQAIGIRVIDPLQYDALEYQTVEEYFDRADNLSLTGASDGIPRYYTILDNKILLQPAPTSEIQLELVYYGSITPLSDSNTSNWLLARSPDLYLFASLLMAEPYLQNDQRVPLWLAAVNQAMEAMRMESERAKYPSGALRTRKRSFG